MPRLIDRRVVDDAFDAYIDWREECAAVSDAYERWRQAPRRDARSAFSAYGAALDREECASRTYADLVSQIATSAPDMPALAGRCLRWPQR
jgi:hypothetical protein